VSRGTVRELGEPQHANSRGITVKTLLALATVLAFAGCQSSDPSVPPAPPSTDGVTVRVGTPERITGSYVTPSGTNIEFDTARSGDTLFLHVATTSHVLIHAETTATAYVFHYLDDRLTLSVDKAWIAQVQTEGADGAAAQDESQMHWSGDMAVLDEMLALPEVKDLPGLSRTLGSMGYTGNTYPASLALHKIARQSADALGIEVQPLQVPNENSYCTAYPNQGNNCYGMCGPGCSCWSWVCGDCCYHYGCARHDDWCRQGQWYYCYNITAVIALFGC
jgi:hypothetical protein